MNKILPKFLYFIIYLIFTGFLSHNGIAQSAICNATFPTEPNEMVVNGGFEQHISSLDNIIPDCRIGSLTGICNNVNVRNWGAFSIFINRGVNTPDYYTRTASTAPLQVPQPLHFIPTYQSPTTLEVHDPTNLNNQSYVGLLNRVINNGLETEGVSTQLRWPAQSGKSYIISAWVYLDYGTLDVPFYFYFHNNVQPGSAGYNQSPIYTTIVRDDNSKNFDPFFD
jgi:hypothetical protein